MKPLTVKKSRRGRGKPLQRRQMRTHRKWTWRRLLHAPVPQLVALAVVLCGLYFFATSRVFAVTTVDVVGDSNLPTELLQQTCQCLDDNIFLAQPPAIETRLKTIPWLDVHSVYGRLPNRIVIDASFRQPVALWRTTVATYTVDSAGTILYEIHHAPAPSVTVPTTATVPMIYSPSDGGIPRSQVFDATRGLAVKMALAARADLARAAPDVAPTVDRYRWSMVSGLSLHSTLGWWATLGINLHDQLRQRIDTLVAAKRQGVLKGCNYVDLRTSSGQYCHVDAQWALPWGPPP